MTTIKQNILAGRITKDMTFSQKVWAVTVRIPRGQVTTYGTIAKTIGQPKAARAVGQALNKNPYAPQVPCHRVVGASGKLTGFASGLKNKQRLLNAEGVKVKNERVDTDSFFIDL